MMRTTYGFLCIAALALAGYGCASDADIAKNPADGGDGGSSSGSSSGSSGASSGSSSGSSGSSSSSSGGSGSSSGSDASLEGGLPALCKSADKNIDWVLADGGLDCTMAAPQWPWAMGMGATWEAVFESQCETALAYVNCANQAQAYYSCLATNNGVSSCSPCATPNQGECKYFDGVVYPDTSCRNDEFNLATCLCGNPDGCIW